MAARDGATGRLGDQRRVGAVAADQRGERAVAGALLLGDGLDVHVRGRLEAGGAERVHREDHRGDARLHVVRAAAVHPAVADRRAEGREAPHLRGAFGHDVDVALEDEAVPGGVPGAVGGDDLH
jgi:hypothetical protein